MKIKVRGCLDCPFNYDSGWACRLADAMNDGPEYENGFDDSDGSPDWCPLKREDTTITLA